MAELSEETATAGPADDKDWDDLVEELLEVDHHYSNERRKSSTVSIVLPPADDNADTPSPGTPPENRDIAEDSTGQDAELTDQNCLAVERANYIFEDGDSVILSEGEISPLQRESPYNSQLLAQDRPPSDPPVELPDIAGVTEETRAEAAALIELMNQDDMLGLDAFIEEHKDDIGALCLVSDESGTTPVTAAAAIGSLSSLEKLSEAGVWLSCHDDHGLMAIHRATENGHNELVEWLADQGQWTGISKEGMSPLHIAARCGHFQVADTLLKHIGAADEELTRDGHSSLHLAAINGHANLVELLISKGSDLNQTIPTGKTALHLAAEAGETAIVDVLLMYGSEVNCQVPWSKKTPLHLAVENSHDQVVCKLLAGGADVDIVDSKGESVMHKFHLSGLPSDCVDSICRKSADIDSKTPRGRTALFLAVEHGTVYVSSILMENGANPNTEVASGCTPLYAATHHGHWELVEKLLLAGADIDKQTDNGSTALYKACRSGLYHIVALLLCSGAKVDIPRKTGWTALHVAVHHKYATIVEQLVACGANVNVTDNQGQTPLAIAAYIKDAAIVKLLTKTTGDPISVYNVAKLGNTEVVKFLQKCGVSLETRNHVCGWQAIHHAAIDGSLNAINVLSAARVDINSQDSDGFTPLHLAILHNHTRAVELLLKKCCYTYIPSKKGENCMSLAVQRGCVSIVKTLLRHGVSADEPDADGRQPLVCAIENGHKDISRLLVSNGATVNACDSDPTPVSPVQLACRYGDADLLKMMLHCGARLEQRDNVRNTLLHIAANYGQVQVVLELITMQQTMVNAENLYRKKPLHLAAVQGHPLVVETLLSAGTKVSIMDSDDTVNYDMAKHKEVWEVLRRWAEVTPSMLVPSPTRSSPTRVANFNSDRRSSSSTTLV